MMGGGSSSMFAAAGGGLGSMGMTTGGHDNRGMTGNYTVHGFDLQVISAGEEAGELRIDWLTGRGIEPLRVDKLRCPQQLACWVKYDNSENRRRSRRGGDSKLVVLVLVLVLVPLRASRVCNPLDLGRLLASETRVAEELGICLFQSRQQPLISTEVEDEESLLVPVASERREERSKREGGQEGGRRRGREEKSWYSAPPKDESRREERKGRGRGKMRSRDNLVINQSCGILREKAFDGVDLNRCER
eukprot:764110-Hanusia_phi.AAC.5